MDKNIPEHIAIIMDGNGRWAKKRLLPRKLGHRAGAQTLNKLIKYADEIGIKHMTVYAFSTENWNRSKEEVDALMNLLREYISDYIRDNKDSNIKVDMIGDINALDKDIQEKIKELEDVSSIKKGMNLHIAINYGGRNEILRSFKNIYKNIEEGKISFNDITEKTISNFLDTKNFPDPDLIIRTSGELRLSNFMIWQAAYSEFYITDKLWPDFNKDDLLDAIEQYKSRNRRFGGR